VTLRRWRAEYGAVDRAAVKRLNNSEKENARLKRMVAAHKIDMFRGARIILEFR